MRFLVFDFGSMLGKYPAGYVSSVSCEQRTWVRDPSLGTDLGAGLGACLGADLGTDLGTGY
eukprot:3143184-Rhodomonas_salina.1